MAKVKNSYQKARYTMIQQEKLYMAKIWTRQIIRDRYFDDEKDRLLADILKGTVILQQDIKARNSNHNGWLRDIEQVRKEILKGYHSPGKSFAKRLFRLTAIWKFYQILNSKNVYFPESLHDFLDAFDDIASIPEGLDSHDFVEDVGPLYEWDFNYYTKKSQARQKKREEEYDRDQKKRRQTWTEDASRPNWSDNTWSTWNEFFGDHNDFFGTGMPPGWQTHGAQLRRPDDWAYARMAAIPENKTWFEILDVKTNTSPKEVKKAYRLRSRATHPDHGGDANEFMMVAQAYEVYNKIKPGG